MTTQKEMTLNQQYGMVQVWHILRLFFDKGFDFKVETEEKAGNIYKRITIDNNLFVDDILSHQFCFVLRPAEGVELTPETENRLRIYEDGYDDIEEVDLYKGVDLIFKAVI